MPFHIKEVSRDTDFSDIVRVEWAAYEDPYQPLIHHVLYPSGGSEPGDREAALQKVAQRKKADYQRNPAAVCLQMIDQETGKMVAGAEWHFYDGNPFETPPTVDCYWVPEGEDRKIANHIIQQLIAPHVTYMQRPHAFLYSLYTLPKYRNQGIGAALVDWGIEKADSKGLCTYIDATEMGYSVYVKKGFSRGKLVEITLQDLPDSPRRRQMEKEILPTCWWPTYRPVGGKSPSAGDPLPWEGE